MSPAGAPSLDYVEVAVPQSHAPGAEAEVDFAEFHAAVAGVLVKLWIFVMRLSHSVRRSMSRSPPGATQLDRNYRQIVRSDL